MNRLTDYKTLLFNNELLHLPFFPPRPHPIPFQLPAQNNLSPFNDMQMNFHEPHDPMRWLNWDDISCHCRCFLLPFFLSYLNHLPTYPRQRPTADIKGLIVTSPLWVFFVSRNPAHSAFPPAAAEIGNTWLVVAAPKTYIGQKCTITAVQNHHRGNPAAF